MSKARWPQLFDSSAPHQAHPDDVARQPQSNKSKHNHNNNNNNSNDNDNDNDNGHHNQASAWKQSLDCW